MMSSPSRLPHLFPPRIYELTYRMLEHAVHAELGNLVGINLTESPDTCQLIVDQCIALAECIIDRRSFRAWPGPSPTEGRPSRGRRPRTSSVSSPSSPSAA